MKKTTISITLSLMIIAIQSAFSQWSSDPANPGVVCDYANVQNELKAFADDEGGIFVFWLDKRNDAGQGARDVYGQHFDMDGYPQWEEDGRQIISHYNRLDWFTVNRMYNGEIIIGWRSTSNGYPYPDTLRIQRLDETGSKVWTNDLVVGYAAPSPISILSVDSYSIIHDNSGYCISLQVIYYGGSNGNRITRFTSDGILNGYINGEPEGTQYYFGGSGLLRSYDAGDNVYLYYSGGNGAGAMLYCLKLNPAGDTLWGPVNVLEGTNGLSYQFSAISDLNGITFVWQGNGVNAENLYARRWNADGTMGWNGTTLTLCDEDGSQGRFYWKPSGQYYYMVWADGRPGVSPGYYDIYAQKFDVNGNLYWAPNGIEVASLNTYIPYPEFEFSDNNSMIVSHQSTIAGFVAQKVLDDGTLAWDADGYQICTPSFNPFYADHIEVQSGNNVIATWSTGGGTGNDNIYITRIDYTGTTGEKKMLQQSLHIYPSPASDHIYFTIPAEMVNPKVMLFDAFGREVKTTNISVSNPENKYMIPLAGLKTGVYLLRVEDNATVITGKVIVQ